MCCCGTKQDVWRGQHEKGKEGNPVYFLYVLNTRKAPITEAAPYGHEIYGTLLEEQWKFTVKVTKEKNK